MFYDQRLRNRTRSEHNGSGSMVARLRHQPARTHGQLSHISNHVGHSGRVIHGWGGLRGRRGGSGVMLVGSGTSRSSGRTGANFLNEYAGTIIQDTGTDITVAVQTGAGEDNTASRATIMDITIWGTQTNVGPAQNQSATYSAKTTASSGTGTVTSLTVGALPYAIASGVSFQLSTDVTATKITFTLTAPAAQGATKLFLFSASR